MLIFNFFHTKTSRHFLHQKLLKNIKNSLKCFTLNFHQKSQKVLTPGCHEYTLSTAQSWHLDHNILGFNILLKNCIMILGIFARDAKVWYVESASTRVGPRVRRLETSYTSKWAILKKNFLSYLERQIAARMSNLGRDKFEREINSGKHSHFAYCNKPVLHEESWKHHFSILAMKIIEAKNDETLSCLKQMK